MFLTMFYVRQSGERRGHTMAEKRFSEETKVRMPPALNEALDRAVLARCTTKSEYVRHAVLQQLKADGMPFAKPERAS
jgi:hypothetical protein